MYNNKYKEREPQETIKILREFFKDRNLIVKENILPQSEAETWSCSLKLFSNDRMMFRSNGKGMTLEYCLASAYAELYERFCNSFEYKMNHKLFKLFYDERIKSKGFCYDKNEKQISLSEALNSNSIQHFYNTLIPDLNYRDKFLATITNDKYLGIPFLNCNNENNIKYYDIRLCQHVTGSTGMAAGNTLDEALNQGMSEFYERLCGDLIYSNPQEKYYELNIDDMSIPAQLKEKINKIKAHPEYILKFYDLGYNYNLPVILAVLINKKNYKIIPNLGSFPIFEIALERTITELYQGLYSFIGSYPSVMERIQKPFIPEKYYDSSFLNSNSSYAHAFLFNEDIIINKTNSFVNEPSSAFMSNTNVSNQEIRKYLNELNQNNKMNFYYFDMSLSESVKAIYVFCDNIYPFSTRIDGIKMVTNWQNILEIYFNYYELSQSILNSNEDVDIENLIKNYPPINGYDIGYRSVLLNWNVFFSAENNNHLGLFTYPHMISKICSYKNIYEGLSKEDNAQLFEVKFTIQKYLTINHYLKVYSPFELKNLFNDIGFDITDNDLKYIYDRKFLLNRCFTDNWRKSYKAEYLLNFIKALI